jgi:hypothetical protein
VTDWAIVIEHESRHTDKTTWGPGPWQDEPDKLQWHDAATGLPCLLVRGGMGAWCGYVGIYPGHPLHGCAYAHPLAEDVRVHGGLTFADACQAGEEQTGICHIPQPGESDDVWWFGFDCGHSEDVSPRLDAITRDRGLPPLPPLGPWTPTYRCIPYVVGEVALLARQLADLA